MTNDTHDWATRYSAADALAAAQADSDLLRAALADNEKLQRRAEAAEGERDESRKQWREQFDQSQRFTASILDALKGYQSYVGDPGYPNGETCEQAITRMRRDLTTAEARAAALAGQLAGVTAALRTQKRLAAEWDANRLGGIAIQRARWKKLAEIARATLAGDLRAAALAASELPPAGKVE